ncbi:beta-N-acetylhexosaminidase family protein [Streptomyces blattellae]|uniref:beta-N-acetylhexosaminidase family protein n=1 Tax=Streptomyces blattellae TaxID=2569855 RepID=UPI0012B93486|nr:beta-N-acetylglucosaminidase domain-containing protein [Streptomyces blattellae]
MPKSNPRPRPRAAARLAVTGLAATGLLVPAVPASSALAAPTAGRPRAEAPSLPVVTPQPQRMTSNGGDLTVPATVRLARADDLDEPTEQLVTAALRRAGAQRIETVGLDAARTGSGSEPLTVVVGPLSDDRVADALRSAGGQVPETERAEGYALASRASQGAGGTVVLAGADTDGTYYAAQTFRQLVSGHKIAAVSVNDYPLMPLRGAIEGFYGSPWTHAERMDQLAFYGDVRMNTYIYAPKDDPYHREQWRDPYPADKLAELGQLVGQATDHHVRFTFAISPGVSICYSDEDDIEALEAKLQSMYDLGVRSFSVPLDDINYGRWNCAGDEAKYGRPGQAAAARAQVDLLNHVQENFLDTHEGTRPLQMVPTEYWDVADSPYKTVIREQLDPRVEVMWTGPDVVPRSISVEEAKEASDVWGRKVFLWDNYPVNDFGESAGRLHLAPYDGREAGLNEELSGIVLNPMNQASASKVALYGGADFSWNDTAYDPERTWRAAADYLSGGDARTTEALLAFFDTQHYASTFGSTPWQPQAPELTRRLDAFRTTWAAGDRETALRELRPYAELLAATPERLRDGVQDEAFIADSEPWLDALDLWGEGFLTTLDALAARADGDEARAAELFDRAAELADEAGKIRTIPGETRPEGTVKVADGVLDTFLEEAPELG